MMQHQVQEMGQDLEHDLRTSQNRPVAFGRRHVDQAAHHRLWFMNLNHQNQMMKIDE
jgi:hypothetical protein